MSRLKLIGLIKSTVT